MNDAEENPKPEQSPEGASQPGSGLKFLLDFGPLLAFFIAFKAWGILPATGVLMGAMVIALPMTWRLEGKLPTMPVVTTVMVLVFGGFTLWLKDERFIKMKPTIVYLLFSSILGGGLLFGRALFKPLLGSALKLEDEGWHKLTLRWTLFFLSLAVLNEIIWRNFTTGQWATFKVFGTIALTFVFMMTQIGLLQRYQIPEPEEASGESPE